MNAIEVSGLTKTYRLYASTKDRLKEIISFNRRNFHQDFHALHNVSFTVEKGQALGVIGRNGSGKSTLLQIICRVLQATHGSVAVNGRISELLELGAGFNPEFTGRDNVYMNGALKGFSKKEMTARFHDIEEFADIGQFIDQPVKTYSSGMFVRLAFAAAINVDPDILVVDEALAVGDALFQSKCYAKFQQFKDAGKTLVFVTHSLGLITTHCTHAILLDRGTLISTGDPKSVVDAYGRLLTSKSQAVRASPVRSEPGKHPSSEIEWEGLFKTNPQEDRYGNMRAEILEAGIFDDEDHPVQILERGKEYLFKVKVRHNERMPGAIVACSLKDPKGTLLCGTNTAYHDIEIDPMEPGDTIVTTFRQRINLNPGEYILYLGCGAMENHELILFDRRVDYMAFQVTASEKRVGVFDPDATIEWARCGQSARGAV